MCAECRFRWTPWVEFVLTMVCAWCVSWGVPINVVSWWYACRSCLFCVANRGVCMVFVWWGHVVLLFGVRVVSFWYGSGVGCHVTDV